jgi:hypothetical protein
MAFSIAEPNCCHAFHCIGNCTNPRPTHWNTTPCNSANRNVRINRDAGFSTSIFTPIDDAAKPTTLFAIPNRPNGWCVNTSCASPMMHPVTVPATLVLRARAKKMVTSNGRSKRSKRGYLTGSVVCTQSASNETAMTATGWNRTTSTPSRDICRTAKLSRYVLSVHLLLISRTFLSAWRWHFLHFRLVVRIIYDCASNWLRNCFSRRTSGR